MESIATEFAKIAFILLAFIVSLTVCMELISILFYFANRKNLMFENKQLKKENEYLKKLLDHD